jgi:hypothetical protein
MQVLFPCRVSRLSFEIFTDVNSTIQSRDQYPDSALSSSTPSVSVPQDLSPIEIPYRERMPNEQIGKLLLQAGRRKSWKHKAKEHQKH